MIRVTVFNEYVHERNEAKVREVYPNGIHGAIAQALGGIEDITVKCVTMDMPENGLPQQLLDETDVLIWWAHLAHNQVSDEVARRVQRRVLDGMGFVALHSAHASKPFSLLLGTRSPVLRWRENDEQQRVWCVSQMCIRDRS